MSNLTTPPGPPLPQQTLVLAQLGVLAVLALLVGGLAWLLGLPLARDLRADSATFGWGLAIAGGLMALNLAAYALLPRYVPSFRFLADTLRTMIAPVVFSLNPWGIVAISLMAGIGEEWIFRGWLQPALGLILPLPVALGVTAFLFALIHFPHPSLWRMVVYYLHYGVILGWVAVATPDGLARAMVAHTAYDLAMLAILRRYPATFGLEPALDESPAAH